MATFKSRGQIINQTETVQLRVTFYDLNGDLSDTDLFPSIKIIEPSGNILLGPTSAGVYRLAEGIYGFDYALGINASLGVWTDFWVGKIGGQTFVKEMNFVVHNTQMPMINSDGYESLGDESPFNYNQTAIHNINKLLKALKHRLNSSGFALSYDQYGNKAFVSCDIYSTDELVTFLAMSLAKINHTPHFTQFEFDNTDIINLLFQLIVQGGTVYSLAPKALIEKGREATMSVQDSGISFQINGLADLLNTQWNTEMTSWMEECKYVKSMMKSAPISMGVLTMTGGGGSLLPTLKALASRREGRIF